MQVVSCHCYPFVYHPFVQQLTIFCTHCLVCRHLLSSTVMTTMSDMCQKVCINPYNFSIVNPLWTDIQAQPHTKTTLVPATPTRLCASLIHRSKLWFTNKLSFTSCTTLTPHSGILHAYVTSHFIKSLLLQANNIIDKLMSGSSVEGKAS